MIGFVFLPFLGLIMWELTFVYRTLDVKWVQLLEFHLKNCGLVMFTFLFCLLMLKQRVIYSSLYSILLCLYVERFSFLV